VSGSLRDFVSGPGFGLPTLTRFFYLDDYPSLLPGLGVLDPGSWIFFGIWIFFFFCLRGFVCLDFVTANWPFASGLGVSTPVREHSSRGSFWPLVYLLSFAPRGSQNLINLLSHGDSRDLHCWNLRFLFFSGEYLFESFWEIFLGNLSWLLGNLFLKLVHGEHGVIAPPLIHWRTGCSPVGLGICPWVGYLYTIFAQSCYSLFIYHRTGCSVGNSSCIVLIHRIWISGIFLFTQSCCFTPGGVLWFYHLRDFWTLLSCTLFSPLTTFLSLLKVFWSRPGGF